MRSIEFGSYPRFIEPQKEQFVEKKEPAVTESEGGDLKQTEEEAGKEDKEGDSENPERAVEDHKVAGDSSPFPLKQSLQELFDQAVKLHDRGVEGDAEAVKKAYDLLTTLRLRAPQNALVDAYYGSVTALLGRDAIDPNERFKKALKGLKTLDGAVATDPGNVQIRILRAYVSYRLPEMYFHRTKTAIEDFGYLISRYEKDPKVFSREFYWQLLYDLGASYKRLEQHREADATWSRLLSVAEDPKYKNLLQTQGFKLSGEAWNAGFEDTSGPEAEPAPAKKKDEVAQEGMALYELALSGDKEAANKAYDFFSKALAGEPENLLLKAYHADCLSLKGRHAAEPTEMFANAIKAMKVFDSVVNSKPDDVMLRLMRARHSFRLPEAFFRRTATAVTDFEYLIGRYEKDRSVFPRETYWQLLYDLGEAYQRLGLEEESRSAWRKLLLLRPDPKYRAMIDEKRGIGVGRRQKRRLAPRNQEELFREGMRLHDLGVAGDKKAVTEAREIWQKAYDTNPRDAVAQAYYGSCLGLAARDSTDPNTLFSDTIKGLKLLNRAVGRDPNNATIRLLRAYFTYSLPESFFHLTGRAIKDFRYLKTLYERDGSIFSKALYQQILRDLASAYKRTGQDEKAGKVLANLQQDST